MLSFFRLSCINDFVYVGRESFYHHNSFGFLTLMQKALRLETGQARVQCPNVLMISHSL